MERRTKKHISAHKTVTFCVNVGKLELFVFFAVSQVVFYIFKRRNERFSFHQSLDKKNANRNKTKDKKKKHKSKMLGGQGHFTL